MATERTHKDFITSYLAFTEESEPPRLFREWCSISIIAAALQRKCWLQWGTFQVFPNLYVVLVAPPGRARKGTAMQPAKKLLGGLETLKLASESVTREALIQTILGAEQSTLLEDGRTYIHSSLTVFSPELTVFLGYQNTQLVMDLTDWFDCGDMWVHRTKTQGTDEITGVFLNLLGATTPETLRSALPKDAIGGGLTSRMIFVYEENKGKIVPFPMMGKEEIEMERTLRLDLQKIHLMSGKFKPTQDYLKLWKEWYVSQDGKNPFGTSSIGPFGGYVERRPTQIMKLAQVMSASRGEDMILKDIDLARAIDLLERTEVQMPKVFGGMGQSRYAEVANQLVAYVARQHERGAERRDLMRSFLPDFAGDGKVFDFMLNQLVEARVFDRELRDGHLGRGIYYTISEEVRPNDG